MILFSLAFVMRTGLDHFPVAKVHRPVSIPCGELRDSRRRQGSYRRVGCPRVHERRAERLDRWNRCSGAGALTDGNDAPGHGMGPADSATSGTDRPCRKCLLLGRVIGSYN